MATVEVQSVTSALLPVEGTEVQQELRKVTKDVEAEAQATEETVAEEPKEELVLTTESPVEVLVVQKTETSKDPESKEVEEVHNAETPKEEEAEVVVELQEAEILEEKESHEVVDIQEAEAVEEEESKELIQEAEPISKEAAEKMEVWAKDSTTEVAIEGRTVSTEESAVVGVEGCKEAVQAEEKNECASYKEGLEVGLILEFRSCKLCV